MLKDIIKSIYYKEYMIFSAFISSFCISMIFFIISLILETPQWAIFIMITSFFVCLSIIVILGIPFIILLQKLNKLKLPYVLVGGLVIGFMFPLMLIIIGDGTNWNQEIKSTIIPSLLGILASAIFYKTLLFRERKKP